MVTIAERSLDISIVKKRLREELDIRGWKSPWHEHFKTIQNGVDLPYNPDLAPVYTVNCSASECEAEGCPRTESGFPKGD